MDQTSKDGDFSPGCSSVHQKRSDTDSGCVSMKSDRFMDQPLKFRSGDTTASSVHKKISDPEPSCVSMRSDQSVDPPKFQHCENRPACRPDVTEPECKRRKIEQSEYQPQDLIENMCPDFSHKSDLAEVFNGFRSNLRKKFEDLYEGISKQGNPTLLNEIYTELYITESESGEISNEHEVRQIEIQSRRTTTEETPIKCNDIFKPLPEQDKHIRSVLTKGVAGIGKTVSVQKFILDWAEEKENQDVQLIFPLPFREINLMKGKTLSLLDLLHHFFPETKEMEIFSDKYKVLFIFDGLDECRLSLDFHSSVRLCDVNESTSVDVMLTNLIKGNLFPSARIWITSRPAAADLIPSMCVDRVTEVRGFSDKQKEEYFRKRISDKSLSDQIISHLKSSRSLYIMCHIPVFCWISVTVLERILSEAERREIPKTLTQMYTHFLIIQTNIKHQKDYEKKVKDEEMIFKLGKLAFEQLVKGNLIFYDEDLRDCGIDVAEASVYSGLCTQIFRGEFGFCQRKVYSFVHLSIQEYIAALYVHLSFIKDCIHLFSNNFFQFTLFDLHQKAVDVALDSKNGHLDLFLRFLLGLSVESNQNLIRGLMTQTDHSSHSNEKTVEYIKKKIRSTQSPEKSINLFHCLNELGDHSLVEEIQHHLKYKTFRETKLSSIQWSVVVFLLLTSEQKPGFNLKKFVNTGNKAETLKVLQELSPVICESRSVQLYDCNITAEGCLALSSALTSNPSHLRELYLTENDLGDLGVKLISDVLKNPQCKLEKLELECCNITDEGCVALTLALRSNPSHLKDLNLTYNKLRYSGVMLISDVLKNSRCKLEKIRLWGFNITAEGGAALTSNLLHVTKLNQFNNNVGDSVVKLLSVVLKNPRYKLEKVELCDCNITPEGWAALTSALTSNPSHLRELNLSDNDLGDCGVKIISDVLKNPQCKLEKLWLSDCNITDEGCVALSSALTSNPSHITDLNLSENNFGDSGVKLICDVLKNPDCKLQKLKLWSCNITAEGCVALTSALRSNPSHLTHLNLSDNEIGDSGMKLISDVLKNPACKLKILGLECCNITDEDVDVTSDMRSNPSHLRDLDLSSNELTDSEVKLISDLKDDPHYKLETVRLNPELSELNLDSPSVCQCCVNIVDSDQWDQVKPSVFKDNGESKFRISTPPGHYECIRTRMRWVCECDVTLQYHPVDGRSLIAELERLQCERIGPVFDVTVISGKLKEVHLPHYVCLGKSDPLLKDAVKVLNQKDEGVVLQPVELTRFHAKIDHPSFSLITLITNLFTNCEEHCDLLLYMVYQNPLILHVYFYPLNDTCSKEKVEEKEKSSRPIRHPRPDRPFRMKTPHLLEIPDACVQPIEGISFRRDIEPNFFKVKINCDGDVQMTLTRKEDGASVWEATVWKSELAQINSGQIQNESEQHSDIDIDNFISNHMPDLVKRVKNFKIIADKLLQEKIIQDEKYSEIINKSTSQDSMREICSVVNSAGTAAKEKLILILQEVEPCLYEELLHPDSP
ncbi:NACHT, LRR and PYD domains-containing protein 1 homolog isoform X2 [Paramisgurnus dabryanus]|uniref:NACHT, LRR and PYD domains-containing protein 1 homolog isoform X2 n=1 Tax=Paramisgurnus dabryanus TaxID=90735 RepID=UPI0031F43ED4